MMQVLLNVVCGNLLFVNGSFNFNAHTPRHYRPLRKKKHQQVCKMNWLTFLAMEPVVGIAIKTANFS